MLLPANALRTCDGLWPQGQRALYVSPGPWLAPWTAPASTVDRGNVLAGDVRTESLVRPGGARPLALSARTPRL
jgi:hypothetical protein